MAWKKNSKSFINRYSRFDKKDFIDVKVEIFEDDLLNFIAVYAVNYYLLVSENEIPIVFDYNNIFELEL